MLGKITFFLCVGIVSASTIRHNNYCKRTLDITEGPEWGEKPVICNIPYKKGCSKEYASTGGWTWFQHGQDSINVTVVDIQINNLQSMDTYHIHLIRNFDISVMIVSKGGETLSCSDPDCPDNYFTSGKQGNVATGGTITVNWCFDSVEEHDEDLPLIEPVKNPRKFKSIFERKNF